MEKRIAECKHKSFIQLDQASTVQSHRKSDEGDWQAIRTYCDKSHTSWPKYVSKTQELLNITTHFSTECTPIELHFGKPVKDEILKFVDFPELTKINHEYLISFARNNIERNFAVRKQNQRASKVSLKVGD